MIDDWHILILRLWSVRVALVWGVFSGLYMALPAFQNLLNPFWFAGACVVASIVYILARVTNQPGMS